MLTTPSPLATSTANWLQAVMAAGAGDGQLGARLAAAQVGEHGGQTGPGHVEIDRARGTIPGHRRLKGQWAGHPGNKVLAVGRCEIHRFRAAG